MQPPRNPSQKRQQQQQQQQLPKEQQFQYAVENDPRPHPLVCAHRFRLPHHHHHHHHHPCNLDETVLPEVDPGERKTTQVAASKSPPIGCIQTTRMPTMSRMGNPFPQPTTVPQLCTATVTIVPTVAMYVELWQLPENATPLLLVLRYLLRRRHLSCSVSYLDKRNRLQLRKPQRGKQRACVNKQRQWRNVF